MISTKFTKFLLFGTLLNVLKQGNLVKFIYKDICLLLPMNIEISPEPNSETFYIKKLEKKINSS